MKTCPSTIHYFILLFFLPLVLLAQTGTPGSPEEPVRFIGEANFDFHRPDAGLELVVGTQSYQVYRTFPNYPQFSDGLGWRNHHHPMLTYWNQAFYSISAAFPIDEDTKIGCVLLSKSPNGKDWSLPQIVFPTLEYQGVNTLSNHRMGFYIAPNGLLLASTAYYPYIEKIDENGRHIHSTDENKEYLGIAVREIKPDDTLGEIFFVEHNENYYKKSELPFLYFSESGDKKLIEACQSLRNDPVITLHWWEQILPPNFDYPQSLVDFIPIAGTKQFAKGISYYYREDSALVALWKMSYSALSYDQGKSWTNPVKLKTLGEGYPKVWGQRTEDGKYVILWRPTGSFGRYPTALAIGDDGITFDQILTVSDEVYRRYEGHGKRIGPCNYQRGFYQQQADPPGTDMWITYSMSKEDIWVKRIPIPIRSKVTEDVSDDFDEMETNGVVNNWNIYHPKYANVSVAEFPSKQNKSLQMKDRDPHDYSKALRIFPESQKALVEFKVFPNQNDHGRLEIEICDPSGVIFFNLSFAADSMIYLHEFGLLRELGTYQPQEWVDFAIDLDATRGLFTLNMNKGQIELKDMTFTSRKIRYNTMKRLVFRTGPYRGININPVEPETDKPMDRESVFYIDDVNIENKD